MRNFAEIQIFRYFKVQIRLTDKMDQQIARHFVIQ